METKNRDKRTVHQGRNVRKVRESKGLKQQVLADMIGKSQQTISNAEQQRTIDPKLLLDIAHALEVPVELLENMEDTSDISFYIENNTFEEIIGNAGTAGENIYNNYCSLDEIKEIFKEKEVLYERFIKEKQDEIDFLRKLLAEKK